MGGLLGASCADQVLRVGLECKGKEKEGSDSEDDDGMGSAVSYDYRESDGEDVDGLWRNMNSPAKRSEAAASLAASTTKAIDSETEPVMHSQKETEKETEVEEESDVGGSQTAKKLKFG